MMRAWVCLLAGSSDWKMGMRNASVFPEPVAERRTTSASLLHAAIDWVCISFNALIWRLDRILSIEILSFDMKRT